MKSEFITLRGAEMHVCRLHAESFVSRALICYRKTWYCVKYWNQDCWIGEVAF